MLLKPVPKKPIAITDVINIFLPKDTMKNSVADGVQSDEPRADASASPRILRNACGVAKGRRDYG